MIGKTLAFLVVMLGLMWPATAAETLRVGTIFSTAQTASQSFLRFHNTGTVGGTVTVRLRDTTTGQLIATWTSPAFQAGSQQQYFIGTIESGASPPIAAKPAYYAISLEPSAGLTGYFQHVLYRPADGTLTNLSTCDVGTTSGTTQVSGVHTSLLASGYPSSIAINNTGTAAASASLGVFNANNGSRLGTYTSASIPAGGQLIVPVTAIQTAINFTPNSVQYHLVVKIEGAFTGFLQHLVNNVQAGVTTDMTTVCALSGAVSAAPSTSARAGAIFATTQAASQSFVRFHNTGTSAGTATMSLRHATTGQTLATWTSPSIPAGSQQQYFIGTIENGASQSFVKPSYYNIAVESQFAGYFQHVLWRPSDGTLTNLSTCDAGIKSDIAQISGVHSSLLAANYPSSVAIANTGAAAIAPKLGIYDANTGARLGTYTSASIAPGGQAIVSVTAMEAGAGIAPTAVQYHYVVKADGVFTGFLQHLVDNRQVGVITDMTTVCALAAKPTGTTLAYVAGSTRKLEQIIGDCDREVQARTGTCQATASTTGTRYNIGGTDLGQSFEDNGRMIFLFGDTLSANSVQFFGRDVFARSTATDPEAPMRLDFFTRADNSLLYVQPAGVTMTGGFNVPDAGVSLADGIYLFLNVGADTTAADPTANAYSIVVRFNETAQTFTNLRTVSRRADGGKFVYASLHKSGSDVLTFGAGKYRADHIYLAKTPQSTYATGAGTQYFAGLVNGQPTWSNLESDAVPVVQDNPLNGPAHPNGAPTVGNMSVAYASALNLWLMTYDGGRNSRDTAGFYFTYAAQPWGPWATPQLIYNPSRDGANGVYIHDPSITPNPPGDGLAGPFIGSTDMNTTPGGPYAPFIIERFITVTGNTLKLYYTNSTWNPYTTLKMRSEFTIGTAPP
ncbi:MAG: DUF4185 domain-containing protein [Rhodospirillaceae bacterium]|nr:DUF4185 domain-containing protein [Rhodospirillaceae bacterium]